MQIYVLGVESRFRGQDLLRYISLSGYHGDVIWGDDARTLTQGFSYLSRKVSKFINGREISLGEYCCTLGHERIYRSFVESGEEWALVLEEDANILTEISRIEKLTSLRKGPTIIHLAGIESSFSNTREETFWPRQIHPEFCDDEEILLFQILGNVFGTFGYLINRQAAEIAILGNRKLLFPQLADWPSTWRHKVNFYLTDLPYVAVDTKVSDLTKDRDDLLSTSHGRRRQIRFMKFRGWGKLISNILFIEPLFRSFFGLSFRSVVHQNIVVYIFSRLTMRLRASSKSEGSS